MSPKERRLRIKARRKKAALCPSSSWGRGQLQTNGEVCGKNAQEGVEVVNAERSLEPGQPGEQGASTEDDGTDVGDKQSKPLRGTGAEGAY